MAIVKINKGLSWGIYEFPIIGGIMRAIETIPGVSLDLNKSPQLRVLVPLVVGLASTVVTAGVGTASLPLLLSVTAAGGTASYVASRGATEYNARLEKATIAQKINAYNKDIDALNSLAAQATADELENIDRAKTILENERRKLFLIIGGGAAVIAAGIWFYYKKVK